MIFCRAKEQVKERIEAITASLNAPSAPSEEEVDGLHQNGHPADAELQTPWEDVKELLVLENCKYKYLIYVFLVLTSFRVKNAS